MHSRKYNKDVGFWLGRRKAKQTLDLMDYIKETPETKRDEWFNYYILAVSINDSIYAAYRDMFFVKKVFLFFKYRRITSKWILENWNNHQIQSCIKTLIEIGDVEPDEKKKTLKTSQEERVKD